MQDVETLHRAAMELVDKAVLARQQGDAEAVIVHSRLHHRIANHTH
jgi:hypothetical protein